MTARSAPERVTALVIGGGPAGLMAAEILAGAGHQVVLAEAMPTIGRKFLMAGRSGLNLTKAEDPARFRAAYGSAAHWLDPALAAFGPDAVQDWARGLGQPLFTGSTGRVFPETMKASPLLRAWRARLEATGVAIRTRWRWTGWHEGACRFDTPGGALHVEARATVLAFGGASWRRLGSDGAWGPRLADAGVDLAPFAPSNAGLSVAWSEPMARHSGTPLKGIRLEAGGARSRGEVVITARGLEGGGLYPLTPALRAGAALRIDLAPDLDADTLAARLAQPRGKASMANHLRRRLGLGAAARALLTEFARPLPTDPHALAALIKAVPVRHGGLRPLDEAISTAGGVRDTACGPGFMLRARPGVFVAGEMLDWEAPTGGYLLTGCLATGRAAGAAAAGWLAGRVAAQAEGPAGARPRARR